MTDTQQIVHTAQWWYHLSAADPLCVPQIEVANERVGDEYFVTLTLPTGFRVSRSVLMRPSPSMPMKTDEQIYDMLLSKCIAIGLAHATPAPTSPNV